MSTCAGCSTTSSRRSSLARNGWCSSPTTAICGAGCGETIASFLYRVWLDGALFGSTAQEAFYVKCDDETNPSEVIEAGQVVCEIGVAAVKPAEFVVFRLAQLPSGTSALAE